MSIEEIKKSLESLPAMKLEFLPSSTEGNSIISPTDSFEGPYFTVIGCGDKQDDLGKLLTVATNSLPGLLSTIADLQRENERLQSEIDRKSSMPGDHRYWEGRYRDEASENKKLREALTPFVLAFENRRDAYSKRYRSNRELGYANFDKMPDDWAMEKVAFNMGTYRRASTALASTGGEHHAE